LRVCDREILIALVISLLVDLKVEKAEN
jgi:hypothetical protein